MKLCLKSDPPASGDGVGYDKKHVSIPHSTNARYLENQARQLRVRPRGQRVAIQNETTAMSMLQSKNHRKQHHMRNNGVPLLAKQVGCAEYVIELLLSQKFGKGLGVIVNSLEIVHDFKHDISHIISSNNIANLAQLCSSSGQTYHCANGPV
jgi:hypothetical protein